LVGFPLPDGRGSVGVAATTVHGTFALNAGPAIGTFVTMLLFSRAASMESAGHGL